MERVTIQRIATGVIALALLLGIGLLTYLYGGQGETPADGSGPTGVAFEETPVRDYVREEVLRLGYGDGEAEIWVDEDRNGSTLETFRVMDDGRVMVADHPTWHVGARVRRFTAAGELERTWLTPPGSLFFEPFGTGIMFVTARGGASTEHVWLMSEDGSVVESFPADPAINSTALVRVDDALCLRTEAALLGEGAVKVHIEPQLHPVVLLTADGPVQHPGATPGSGYDVDTSGKVFTWLVESAEWDISSESTNVVATPEGDELRLPGLAVPVGVDGDDVWMTMPPQSASLERVEVAGWPLGTSHETEVLVAGLDGEYRARIIAPYSPLIPGTRRRFQLTADAFWVMTADTEGVSLLRYTEVTR